MKTRRARKIMHNCDLSETACSERRMALNGEASEAIHQLTPAAMHKNNIYVNLYDRYPANKRRPKTRLQLLLRQIFKNKRAWSNTDILTGKLIS